MRYTYEGHRGILHRQNNQRQSRRADLVTPLATIAATLTGVLV